jgi:hypothetical protein
MLVSGLLVSHLVGFLTSRLEVFSWVTADVPPWSHVVMEHHLVRRSKEPPGFSPYEPEPNRAHCTLPCVRQSSISASCPKFFLCLRLRVGFFFFFKWTVTLKPHLCWQGM